MEANNTPNNLTGWYSTEVDTIYVDAKGRIWLVASQDWNGDRHAERLSALPDGAEEFDATEDWQIEFEMEVARWPRAQPVKPLRGPRGMGYRA